jgi:hypothetical protein
MKGSALRARRNLRGGTVRDLVGDLAYFISINLVIIAHLFQKTRWTYDIDTTVPRNRNDGIESTEVYTDNWTRKDILAHEASFCGGFAGHREGANTTHFCSLGSVCASNIWQ